MTVYVINHSRKVGKKPLENLGPVVKFDTLKEAKQNLTDLANFIIESRHKFISEEQWKKLGWPEEEIIEQDFGYTVKLYDPENDQFIVDLYQIHEAEEN